MHSDSKTAQSFRFVITGGMAAAIQYGIYVVVAGFLGVSAEISTVISYCMSFVFNFFVSNIFTFRTRPNARKALLFALCHLLNLGLQTLLVAVFCNIVSKTMALLPAMAICIPINFILVRKALR